MSEKNNRANALDALRGISILLMILSGTIPFNDVLPAWMYHAQVPPPFHKFDPSVPGITWVDLVFPFFLFSMGAAFPFALRRKIQSGVPIYKICKQTLQRGIALAGFAIIIQHFKPYAISGTPQFIDWLLALSGFALVFLLFARYPAGIKKEYGYYIKAAAFLTIAIIFSQTAFANDTSFSLDRSDIIILVLANTAFFGTLIWLFTRDNILVRLGFLGILLALRLTQNLEGSWNMALWNFSPFPWLYKMYYLQYLFIVIPGSIVGDIVYKWYLNEQPLKSSDDNRLLITIMSISTLLVISNVIFLFSRLLLLNLFISSILLILVHYYLKKSNSGYVSYFKSILPWGTYFLILGLFFEAYEGGIKKDHSTLSYYFITTGLAVFTFAVFEILFSLFRKRGFLKLLTESGQNPMIAYVGNSHVLMPIFGITGIDVLLNYMNDYPLTGFLKGIVITLLVALLTSFFTKRKIFWRT